MITDVAALHVPVDHARGGACEKEDELKDWTSDSGHSSMILGFQGFRIH